ncbi:MAG: NB-ARC domain-containing protein, partial [Planctomycetota bacterium]
MITSIEGMGGIGKTSTSLQAVQELRSDGLFRDGVAFIDLEGFSSIRAPKTSEEALSELLRPLMDANAKLPNESIELQRLWREKTVGLDMLLFLDNARDEKQIDKLLPDHPTCTVLITSRNRLAVAGLQPISLTELSPEDAQTLALRLANRRLTGRLNPAQALQLAKFCGYLPLAIEVTTNTLDQSSGLNVEAFLKKLAEPNQPAPALEKAKASLYASLHVLTNEIRALWQELSVFEGGFDRKAAAAVWETDGADDILADLELRSLIHYDREVDRYRLHDILRAIAFEELGQDSKRHYVSRWRHAAHYCDVLAEANQLALEGGDELLEGFWLYDREEQNIGSGQAWAEEHVDKSEEVVRLLARYADVGAYLLLWFRGSQRARIASLKTLLVVCRKLGDKEIEASALGCLVRALSGIGHCNDGLAYCLEWLAIARETHSHDHVGRALCTLGYIHYFLGQPHRALENCNEAIPILKEVGNRRYEGYATGTKGEVLHGRGDYKQAIELYKQHLKISRDLGEWQAESHRLGSLGAAYMSLGEFQR